jgi:hypothetical protein
MKSGSLAADSHLLLPFLLSTILSIANIYFLNTDTVYRLSAYELFQGLSNLKIIFSRIKNCFLPRLKKTFFFVTNEEAK